MIAKKNPRYDLERKRFVLFQVGLLTTGAFTLAAFNYRSPVEVEQRKDQVVAENIEIFEQVEKEIPRKEDPIIRELPVVQNQSNQATINVTQAVGANIVTTTNTGVTPTGDVGVGGLTIGTGDVIDLGTVEVTGEIIEIPAKDAAYVGGIVEMTKFIQDNLDYPDDAIDMNLQGRVYVSFVVEKDGSVSNVQIERGIYKSIDREAERIVRAFPKWIPGEMPEGKVRTRVRIPINFVLE